MSLGSKTPIKLSIKSSPINSTKASKHWLATPVRNTNMHISDGSFDYWTQKDGQQVLIKQNQSKIVKNVETSESGYLDQ